MIARLHPAYWLLRRCLPRSNWNSPSLKQSREVLLALQKTCVCASVFVLAHGTHWPSEKFPFACSGHALVRGAGGLFSPFSWVGSSQAPMLISSVRLPISISTSCPRRKTEH